MRLAFIGSINDEILIIEELAMDLIKVLTELYPKCFEERYGIEVSENALDTLSKIAENRRCFLKGEELDLKKAAGILIDDYRSGKLGRMTVERPEEQ